MKRFIIFLLSLTCLLGLYNFSVIRHSVSGYFGDVSYTRNELIDAEKRYNTLVNTDSGGTLQDADILYNLGNTFYRLGEEEKETSKKVQLWTESVGSYTKSLSIRTDQMTEENLAFVKEKLSKEQEKQKKEEEEKKKQDEQKTGSGSEKQPDQKWDEGKDGDKTGSGQQEKTGKDGESGKDDQKSGSGSKEWDQSGWKSGGKSQGGNWSNGGSYNPVWGKDDNKNSPLSEADKQEVKKYLEDLKQFEKQNGKLLNPDKPGEWGSLSDQIKNFFGNDSFFQDVIPDNSGKKDW